MSLGWVTAVLLVSTAALVFVIFLGRSAPTDSPSARPPTTPRPGPAPAPMTFSGDTTRIIVDAAGLAVEIRGSGFATGWYRSSHVTWAQTTSLQLDTGALDSPVSLYATAVGQRFRKHLVDGGTLSPAQWATLARRITECTDGRIVLDLRKLYRPRPYEPF